MLEKMGRKKDNKFDKLGILRSRVYPRDDDIDRDANRKELIRKIKEGEIG